MSRAARALILFSACAALGTIGAGLLCVATHEEGLPCTGLCAARFWTRGRACVTPVVETLYEQELYLAVVDTVYRRNRDVSVRNPLDVVLLQGQSVSGERYLANADVLAALRSAAAPESGDSLVRAFRTANAESTSLSFLYRLGQLSLDSATVRRILDASDADAMKEPVVTDVLRGMPLDSLPGILSLSRPGVSRNEHMALMFATLRERRSREADHLEAAAFLIARLDGARWIVTREVPVPGPRGP